MKTTQTTGAAKFTSKRAAVLAFNAAKNERHEAQQALAAIGAQLRADVTEEKAAELKVAREQLWTVEHVAYNKMFDIYNAAEKQGFYITTSLFGHNATRDLTSANCD